MELILILGKMKIVYNNYIPFKGFLAMALWPFVFVRKDARRLKCDDVNHEKIHGCQQIEMLLVFFLLWYVFEWLIRLCQYKGNGMEAYKNISFEREAYCNQSDPFYLNNRKLFSWIKYM